jgi:TonB-linked SusC/RagA family outer membrane protein
MTLNLLTRFLTFIALLGAVGLRAQTQELTGLVTDAQGLALPGVTVQVRGTNLGAISAADGRYRVALTRNLTTADVVTFNLLGFKAIELSFTGDYTLNASLAERGQELGEVVVTALGIRREGEQLGYATQTVDAQQLNDARSNNFVNALAGKVAGLSLISPGSGPLNSVRVSLRGDISLNPDGNNALIVVDGVPVSSGLTTSGVNNAYGAGTGNDVPVDFGNGISDINPDDIASVTVLKGASATALYGSRAANGALLITTKSGTRKDKGIGVTVNSNASWNDILRWPDFQHEYGAGTGTALIPADKLYYSYGASADGTSTGGTSSAFGPRFNGQQYFQYDPNVEGQSPERRLWQPYPNNVKDFWRTGFTLTNNVAIEGGGEKVSVRASMTHSKNEWIMPNTGYERFNAALSIGNTDKNARLKLQAKINFTNKKSDNLPATGYNNQSISYFMIFQNPNVDLAWYEPRWKRGQEQIEQIHPFSQFIDNPYVIAYEMTNGMNNYKTIGSLSATYSLAKGLDLMVRSGIDMTNEDREQRRPYNTANFQRGFYKLQTIFSFEINSDALLTYQKSLSKAFKLTASAGANAMSRRYTNVNSTVIGLVTPGVYKLSNGTSTPLTLVNNSNRKVNSVYGLLSLNYRERIFLDFTGRNDWSSTLPIQNNSFFYPSVSTSIVLSRLLHLPQAISFAKLRLSAAQVGNDTEPYRTRKYYGQSDFPSSASVPTTLHNANFKPEISTSYEAGIEFGVLKSRLTLDATVYENTTRNQILEVPLDPTTGYTRAVLNSGAVRNRGLELVLNAKPVKTKQFSWNTSINWSRNINKVLELAEGLEGKQDIGFGGNATISARIGGTTGAIYGFGFLRAPDGQIIYTKDGLPARPAEIQYIGEAYPLWRGGWSNEFSYKNFRFNFLFSGQYGGMIYSQTHHKMSEQGKLKHTLPGREEGFIIGQGVVDNGDGTFSPNTKQVAPASFYGDYYRRANVESNSFDASFIKLREVRFEYSLPRAWAAKIRMQGLSLGVYGRDLAMRTDFPMFDPETAALNGSTILPGVEMGQLPTPRTFGVNLTVKL